MLLHDTMDEAVADVSADLHALTTASRRQGLAIRRRRRALASVGAVAAIALGGYAVLPGSAPSAPDRSVASDPVDVEPLSGETAPITAGGVAAALRDAVDEVADGAFSRLQGDVSPRDDLAALLFAPEGGSGPAGQVMVTLQPVAAAGAAPYTCVGYLTESISDCTVRQVSPDVTLRTYREEDDTEFGAGSERVVAELIDRGRSRSSAIRLMVSAMNTNPWEAGHYRDRPVLTTEQLTEIATRPWWSRTELPAEYVEAGKAIELYEG